MRGRKDVFSILRNFISESDSTFWFHCASLGEFEQGLPIMEALKKQKPNYKLVVSFFSPSGYEVKKNTPIADIVVYLPLDTPRNAKTFIEIVHPSLAIFVKYEFWPNYLFELKKNNIPTILISGLFRENQSFFKNYGGFMRKSLQSFKHFFVQNEESKALLESIHFNNSTISGDTRFDRVYQQTQQDNQLDFIKHFKQNKLCLVCGSTWLEDENVLLDFINTISEEVKIIIAPHKIETSKIEAFRKKITKKSVLFSEKEKCNVSDYPVFIIDTIGLLSKIYFYADIAYVGGAMGTTGLHNILEPATFGVPIVIGKEFSQFPEAGKLLQLGGLFSIKNKVEGTQILNKLVEDVSFREESGKIAGEFITENTGATTKILEYINSLDL